MFEILYPSSLSTFCTDTVLSGRKEFTKPTVQFILSLSTKHAINLTMFGPALSLSPVDVLYGMSRVGSEEGEPTIEEVLRTILRAGDGARARNEHSSARARPLLSLPYKMYR